jgi:SNF2 family DNA or RNA helicase
MQKALYIQPIPASEPSPKIEWICNIVKTKLDEFPDAKFIVFSEFVGFLNILKPFLEKLQGVKLAFIHGKVKTEERELIKNEFKYSDDLNVLIASIGTTAVGLNLNTKRRTIVIQAETHWNSAIEKQCMLFHKFKNINTF